MALFGSIVAMALPGKGLAVESHPDDHIETELQAEEASLIVE